MGHPMDWTSVLPSGLVISREQALWAGGIMPGGSTSTPTQNRIDSPSTYFGFSSRRTGRIVVPTLCAQVLSGARKYEVTRHRRPACTNTVDRCLSVLGSNIEHLYRVQETKAVNPPRNAAVVQRLQSLTQSTSLSNLKMVRSATRTRHPKRALSQLASPRQVAFRGGSASCGVLRGSADSPANPSEESPE